MQFHDHVHHGYQHERENAVTKYTLSQAQRVWNARIRMLTKQAESAELKVTNYAYRLIRRRAPKKSGNLLAQTRKIGNLIYVGGVDPATGFPYIHWINQTPGMGMSVLRYPRGAWIPASKSASGHATRILAPGKTAIYGSRPSNWNWTGQKRFVQTSVKDARVYAKKIMPEEVRKVFGGTTVLTG